MYKDEKNTVVDSVPPEGWEEGAATIRSSSLGRKLAWAGEKGTITCRKETSLTEFFLCMSLCVCCVFMYIILFFPHIALGICIQISVLQMRQLKLIKVS